MTALTELMALIDREMDAIEAERKRRKIIKDEGRAHAIIETELERQQIRAHRQAALARCISKPGEVSDWDRLTDKDMTW